MIKFAEIEGVDAELAEKLDGNESIQKAIDEYQSKQIEEGVTNRVDVAKAEFKKKMDALGAKLADAETRLDNTPDISPDELKALREARDKNPELQATLDALKKRTKDAEDALKTQADEMLQMQRGQTITQAINEYDSAHPNTTVKAEFKDVVSMLAAEALRFDSDAKTFRVYSKSGEIVATDKGAATPVDWLDMLRTERPGMFNMPAGSGATGSKPTGSATKPYAEMTEAERVALYRQDPAQFNQLKSKVSDGNSTTN